MNKTTYTSRNADKFVVRLPDGLREQISARAKTAHRSMNAEIVNILERDLTAEQCVDAVLEYTAVERTTPVSVGMLAYYHFDDEPEKHSLGVITGIAVSLDNMISVTFDVSPREWATNIVGSIQNDPRHWFPVANIKPYLI